MLAASGEVRLEVVGPDQVLHMKKRGALQADLHERGLQSRQHTGNLP